MTHHVRVVALAKRAAIAIGLSVAEDIIQIALSIAIGLVAACMFGLSLLIVGWAYVQILMLMSIAFVAIVCIGYLLNKAFDLVRLIAAGYHVLSFVVVEAPSAFQSGIMRKATWSDIVGRAEEQGVLGAALHTLYRKP